MKPSRIGIIGSGNVAWQLSHALKEKGFTIAEIISRNAEHAAELAISLKTSYSDTSESHVMDADGYFICVKDDVIDELGHIFPNIKGFVAHVSGTKPMTALQGYSVNTGVFYPLQTFSRFKKIDWSDIPVFIEASNLETSEALRYVAHTLSSNVQELDSKRRSWLHLSAVLVSNFPNYLYTLAEEIQRKHQLDFKDLLPLIRESISKLENATPSSIQTGPAIREDNEILQKHLEMLKSNPEIQSIYQTISDSIKQHYKEMQDTRSKKQDQNNKS